MTVTSIELLARLSRLSIYHRVAFTYFLCLRMIPSLKKFSNDTGFDVTRHLACMNNVRKHLELNEDFPSFEAESNSCTVNVPDTEEFSHHLTSAALNACLSIETLMEFISTHDNKKIMEVGELSRDTVALYLQDIATPSPLSLSYLEVMEHPAVQKEICIQNDALRFFSENPDFEHISQYISNINYEILDNLLSTK